MTSAQVEWPEYRLFAEREFERLTRIAENQQDRIEALERSQARIAAFFGLIGGSVPVILYILFNWHK